MLQVHDDAADIATDFSHGHTNIAIAYSLRAVKDTPTLEAIKHAFYFSGIAEHLYLWVESNATAILQTLPQSAELLHALLAEIAKKSILQRKIIEDYVAEKNFAASYQLSLYDNSSPFNEKLTEAIKLTLQQGKHVNASLGLVGILQHASSSFSEAFHFMHLRADEGFVNNGVYVGNVFALATLSQKLHSFSTKIDGLQLDFLLEPIERYLLSLRQKNFRGTWCYLNGCDFLGADLDDAAQVIRALDAKRFDGDVIEFITFLEQKIIESQSPAPTWIPPITPTDQTDYQQQLTNSLWGDTIDIEVVANTILLFEKLEWILSQKSV